MDSIECNKPDPAKKTICMVAEGTYPYITGGVSSWIQDIISGLEDFNFIIYAISADKDNEIKYKIPPNVTRIENKILTEPGERKQKKINNNFFKGKIKDNFFKGKIDNEFFESISHMHEEMIRDKKFSMLKTIVNQMRNNRYSQKELQKHHKSWQMTTMYGKLHNPLYSFSDYYWAWLASHEYVLKIINWSIPEADLYHTISTGYAGLVASISKIIYNKPVILTEHGLYNKEREIDIKRATFVKGYQRDLWIHIFNDLAKITYDYADLSIALFEHNRNIQISQGAQREKTMVIPNGIEVDRFLDLKKEKKDHFAIGFVGRVVPIKDVKNLIIASKIIIESVSNVKVYIIGPRDEDENYYKECLQLVENFKIKDNIIFTGKQDVRKYYSFIDVLVLSSIREAQPLVILEAYCAGIPCVSTRVGNVPEMLNYDTTLLADPKDSEKLASGIIRLIKDEKYRNKLIKDNREKVLKFYNKKDLINKYRYIYNQYIEMC